MQLLLSAHFVLGMLYSILWYVLKRVVVLCWLPSVAMKTLHGFFPVLSAEVLFCRCLVHLNISGIFCPFVMLKERWLLLEDFLLTIIFKFKKNVPVNDRFFSEESIFYFYFFTIFSQMFNWFAHVFISVVLSKKMEHRRKSIVKWWYNTMAMWFSFKKKFCGL